MEPGALFSQRPAPSSASWQLPGNGAASKWESEPAKRASHRQGRSGGTPVEVVSLCIPFQSNPGFPQTKTPSCGCAANWHGTQKGGSVPPDVLRLVLLR